MASVNLSLRNVEKLPFVKGQGRVEVTFFRVPDSGPLPLPHPILERKETLSMSTNGIKVQLPHISMHEVYLLLLRWTTTG